MKSFTLFGFVFFALVQSFAQASSPVAKWSIMSEKDWGNILYSGQPMVVQNVRRVVGTPFLFDSYLPGAVYLNDSLHSPDNLQFKLNMITNEIWMKKEDGSELILTSPRLVGLVLNNSGHRHSFKRIVLPLMDKPVRKFVEMLYCGSFTLVKEIQKSLVESGDSASGILLDTEKAAYETKIIYYLVDEQGRIKTLRLKRSEVEEMYPSIVKINKSKLDDFCKSHSIGKSLSESEMIEFLTFLSALKN